MKDEINLIPKSGKISRSTKNFLKIFRLISIISFVTVVVSSIVVFMLKSNSNSVSLKAEEQSIISQLSVYKSKASDYFFLSARIKDISEIFSKRPKFDEKIDLIFNNLPSDVILESLTIDTKKIAISASSNSLSSLHTFLDNLTLMANQKTFLKRVVLNGINIDQKKGKANFTISGDLL